MNIEKALKHVTGLTSKEFIEKAIEGGWKTKELLDDKKPKVVYSHAEYEVQFGKNMLRFIYRDERGLDYAYWQDFDVYVKKYIHRALLDKNAWIAVGKADGSEEKQMKEKLEGEKRLGYHIVETPIWEKRMHRFIDTLNKE